MRLPLDEIGTYGGTINVLNITNLPWGDMGEMPERGTYLLQVLLKPLERTLMIQRSSRRITASSSVRSPTPPRSAA